MKAVIWTSADPKVWFYLENNKALQAIDAPLYLICSRGQGPLTTAERAAQLYPRAKIIECKNNLTLKGKLAIEAIRAEMEYDVVIRVDLDAIIVNLGILLDMCRQHVFGRHILMGNLRKNGCIRGGCHATSRTVIEAIDMPVNPNPRRFDQTYLDAVLKTGATVTPIDCFESSGWYSGRCPVWHPPKKWLKTNHEKKSEMFMEQLRRLGNA